MSTPPPAPGHDVFPVHSRAKLIQDAAGLTTGVGVVTQLDLTELENTLAPRLADPDSEFTSVEVIERPGIAVQTKGPHRYTIHVPYNDASSINVGASKHPHSPGISMVTNTSISMRTMTAPKTALGIGAPAEMTGPGAPTAGYSLFTEGASNHTAKLQITLASQDEGLGITTKQDIAMTSTDASMNFSAKGLVTITGKKLALHAVNDPPVAASGGDIFGAIVLIGLDAVDTAAPLAGVKGNGEAAVAAGSPAANFATGLVFKNAEALKDSWMAKASEHGTKVLTHVAALATLWLSYKKAFKSPTDGKSAFQVKAAKFKVVVAALKELKALYGDRPNQPDPEKAGMSIESDSTTSISAKAKITIEGHGGVAVTGGFGGVSLGGLSASLAGQKDASISGGLGVTIKALAGDVEMSSDLKGAAVKAKKDVELSSEAGKAKVASMDDVQVNSEKAKAFVHGKMGVYVGTGLGDAVGLCAGDTKLAIGCITSADTFASAKGNEGKPLLRFDENVAQLTHTADSKVLVSKNTVGLTSKEVKITGKTKILMKGNIIEIN